VELRFTEAEMALAEAIHRARNDLQSVVSMLRLQARIDANPDVRAALQAAEIRVTALASLNSRLDAASDGTNGIIDTESFIRGLVQDLQTIHFEQRSISLNVNVEAHRLLAIHGKPLGLILNELVVNAMKYAFLDGRRGILSVSLHRHANEYVLAVIDDGIGIDLAAPAKGTGLGTLLTRALAVQIGGQFRIGPGRHGGTECYLRWPASASKEGQGSAWDLLGP
jgi:two-component sensor histidine kinase